ncbi:12939_t:CDS:2 [Cetraspora pellucida]|uniref:12939_t:CDS:1 n=1 Tax=Cetraspora pellucida TaxID=1433469 RepID=A0A9N9EU56_9GLOM|nr:12939_t:CDS:2 [Cetraspora pellucida]
MSTDLVYCPLCPRKAFKNQQGYHKHQKDIHTSKINNKNSKDELVNNSLDEFKNILIYTIQKQLKNNIKNIELQSVKFPYLKSQFVGIFGNYLTRYSSSQKWYQCIFKEENAIELVSQILGRTNWSIRSYLYGQQTNIILISSDSTINKIKKDKHKKQKQIELYIEWKQCIIKDATNQISIIGYITMHFFIEQIYFG